MAVERSRELVVVGLFLARCSRRREEGSSLPPIELRTDKWGEAYSLFFDALGDGRSESSFQNTLKNTRDQFDSHLDSGRAGWKVDGEPKPLAELDNNVYHEWEGRSDEALWEEVAQFVGRGRRTHPLDLKRLEDATL